MLFTDPVFLFLLLPLACALFYWATPRFGSSAGCALLLGISLLFYSTWGTHYLVLLILSLTANFIAACAILSLPDAQPGFRRTALYLGQLYNFGTLIWFKYRFFLLSFGETEHKYTLIDAAIPIGISFYTFQQAIFLSDAHRREGSVAAYLGDMRTIWGKLRGYLRHAFFVAFFPHLVMGPIVYLKEFQPQVDSADFGRAKRVNLEAGAALIIIGLFKKMVIADHLRPLADGVFAAGSIAPFRMPLPAAAAWLGIFAYYAQLYFDFSGYSDMALGTARMLGIRFPVNFYSPLKAAGIIDFYRRWHITLTRVIARFVYVPLSLRGTRLTAGVRRRRSAAKIASLWIPLLINFEVIALWHGARLTFIVFGLLHGIWYLAETEVRAGTAFKAWRSRTSDGIRGMLGRAIFLLLMPLTFALFRCASLPDFFNLLQDAFSFHGGTPALKNAAEVLAALAIIGLFPNSMQLLARYRPGIATYENRDYTPGWLQLRWRPDLRWTVVMTGALVASLYYMARQPPFLYLGF